MKNELDCIEDDGGSAAECVIASCLERGGRKMSQSFGSIVRRPSAFVQLGMSFTTLALLWRLSLRSRHRTRKSRAPARRGSDCTLVATPNGRPAARINFLRKQV